MKQILEDLINTLDNEPTDELKHTIIPNFQTSSNDVIEFIYFSDEAYSRNLIHKTDDYELLLLCWKNGQFTPIHHHGISSCTLTVIRGVLDEKQFVTKDNRNINNFLSRRQLACSDFSFLEGSAISHRVECISQKAMSLHFYTPHMNSVQR